MKKNITVDENIADAYKSAGKELWVFQGRFSKNHFSLDTEEKLTVLCETDKMYCTVSEKDNQQFLPIAKILEYDFCCVHTINHVDTFFSENIKELEARVCLEHNDTYKATEMMVEAFKKFIKEHNIDDHGL